MKKSNTTVDTYRCYMKNIGMLEMVSNGIYQKKMNIPKDIRLSIIREAASDHSWREWFMPLHERLGVSEKELL